MTGSKSESLTATDIRALLRLLGELREMGDDPGAWRAHLATNLESLCGTSVAILSELRRRDHVGPGATNCAEVVTALQAVDHGLDASNRDRFYREVYYTDHDEDDALDGIVPLYGSAFTVRRADVVEDGRWERSRAANERFRVLGCDDFVLSMAPVRSLGVICSLELFRPPGRRFTARDKLLVSLVHEELASDWSRAQHPKTKRLTARQREVLDHLTRGASEKEITYDLGLSAHTTHDHVKAIYRAFGARSRGELLSRLAKREPPRVRLVSERA